MNLKHLHLHVRDLGVAEGFYRDWFGLAVSRRYDGLTFLTDDDRFDLALMKDDAPAAMASARKRWPATKSGESAKAPSRVATGSPT